MTAAADLAQRLADHPWFSPWTDPDSSVTSYLLDNRLGPIQQHFYYTNPSITADGNWLWLTVAHPPGPSKHLAAISLDPANPAAVDLPAAQTDLAHPGLANDGQSALFGTNQAIYRASLDGTIEPLWRLPNEWLAKRQLIRLATHIGQASDGMLLIDGELADQCFVGLGNPADGSWEVIANWQQRHDHAQWHPSNPNLFLIAHDQYLHPVTGELLHHRLRTFVMDRSGERYQAINPQFPASPFRGACHEWWSGDDTLSYIEYESGVHEFNLTTGATEHVWQEPLCHAHSDASNRYLVADQSPYYWAETPCQVLHFDRVTGKRTAIATGLPQPAGGYATMRGRYHIDPHPQFAAGAVVWTSTVDERVTVAITPHEQLAG